MERDVANDPGAEGLATRLAVRRAELGLDIKEVARRARLCLEEVEGFERVGAVLPPAGALALLARALETTVESLVTPAAEQAPGTGRANLDPILRRLSTDESERHLAQGGIGRVVMVAQAYPAALPVNFRYDGKAIIFRTAEDGFIARSAGNTVGFEVDRFDDIHRGGWSVLVGGRLQRIDAWQVARFARLGVEPWAGGDRDRFMCIPVSRISGRAVDTQPWRCR